MNKAVYVIREAARAVSRALKPHGMILLYHRVAEPDADPQALCVSPDHFAEHMEILEAHFRPVGLERLCEETWGGSPNRGSVAVTFDDGYRDNLYEAKPLLEKYGVPAVVYVTSGQVGIGREFWWDEVERVFLGNGELPGTLTLTSGGKPHCWDIGSPADQTVESPAGTNRWNVLVDDFPTRRHEVYAEVMGLMYNLPGPERAAAVETLVEWAGLDSEGRCSRMCMAPEEILRMCDGGLVDIGAHTVTHPVLSFLDRDMQVGEIRGSKARLEEITGRPVESFSYPFGHRGSYTDETVGLVREAGFRNACANIEGLVMKGVDPFQLPRFLVRNWDGEEFSRRLRGWFRHPG